MTRIKLEFGGEKPSFFSGRYWSKVLIMSLSIIITTYIFNLAEISSPISAIFAAIVISVLNAFIKPMLVLFSLPLMVLSLGLFNLIINAFIVMFTSAILGDRFIVDGFGKAFLFSIVITIIAFLLEMPERVKRIRRQLEDQFDARTGYRREEEEFTDYEEVEDDEEENN